MSLQALLGVINVSRKESGGSLKGSFMLSVGSQCDRKEDGESKQLAINRNAPKLENKTLGTSHLSSL